MSDIEGKAVRETGTYDGIGHGTNGAINREVAAFFEAAMDKPR